MTRAGIIRPPMISEAQKERFIRACLDEPAARAPQSNPGFARSIWALLGWMGTATVAWVLIAGVGMAWLSW